MLEKIQHLVISRTDNLGDVMLTLPMAGFLKTQFPHLKISFIGKTYTKALIDSCGHIDSFLDRAKLLAGEETGILQSAQAIIFVFPDRELARLSKQLKIPYRVGTSHRWFHWFYVNHRVGFSRKKANLHEAVLNFKLLKPFGIKALPKAEDLSQYYGFKPRANTLKTQLELDKDKFKLIIHPKSKGSAREWPLKNYLSLVKQSNPQNFTFYLTGTSNEGEVIAKECPELLQNDNVQNLTGKLSLSELIQFINQVDGLLACSTGPLHIAAALDKYALGIYPPMKPIHPSRWRPLGKKTKVLVLDKDCQDCRKNGTCTCIEAITVAEVSQQLKAFANQ